MGFLKWMSSAKKGYALLILFLLANHTLYSQTLEPSGIFQHSAFGQNTQVSEGTLHIVAVMVEFQPDTNRFTSGDGTFSDDAIPYLASEDITIDPLPHDKRYFEGHLEFAKNYYAKMSGGALEIEYHVVDKIFRLPNEMKEYSPIGVDPSPEPLAEFARDAWQEVAGIGNLGLQIGPSDQVAFVLFHAGVGRDLELTGTILEKTPQDIPSVYLSRDALRRLFDDPAFTGFPINDGNLIVDNTLILPRTLTRAGEDVTGSQILLQLSINGMVTAQIGSHIGIPDLFNTETGESGIGRFGLMDGAGIFAYNGLFPPELSAWEKIHMGWAEPFEINYDHQGKIDLPAASLRQPGSIAKVPISSNEYFLIENRHREADQTGTTLTIQRPDGSVGTQTFTNADTAFVFQQSGFPGLFEPGVVIDVSNYDFALPGGPAGLLEESEEEDGRILNGGILIWHIDEGVIQNRIAIRRGINSDPDRRGVRLVEADGAQDIGRPTAIGFFQNEVNGSAFDFWWDGNDASVITPTGTITLYENRFGPDTTPNNDSNSGAKSPFELFDFSANLPVASFQIQKSEAGGDLYEVYDFIPDLPLNYSTPAQDSYWSNYPLSTFTTDLGQQSVAYLPARNGIFIYDFADGGLLELPSADISSYQQPFINPEGTIAIAPNPALAGQPFSSEVFELTNGEFSKVWDFEAVANSGFISSPGSDILQFDGTSHRARLNTQTVEENFYPSAGHHSEQANGYGSFISNSGAITIETPTGVFSSQISIPDDPFVRKHIGLIEGENGEFKTFLLLDNGLIVFENNTDGVERRNIHHSENLGWPALADIDNSGSVDFLFVDRAENQLIAKNTSGAILSGFPIQAPQGVTFAGTPLIADLNGNGDFEIIITGLDQQSVNLYGFKASGNRVDGFPLLVGGIENQTDEPVHPSIGGEFLTAISHDGDLRIWQFPNMGEILWGSRYGNSGNNKLTGRLHSETVTTPDFGILNASETYNWPNPARDETFIRYQTSSPGEVQVRIATTSGRLIYDRTVQSRGSGPEEISIDTSGWGSGGYIAVVTATVNGQSERKLVKIAIAK